MSFKIKFNKVDKSLIRFSKYFRNKEFLDMYFAEELMNDAKRQLNSILEIPFEVVDENDDAVRYTFKCEIPCNDEEFSLMNFLQEEIEQSDLDEYSKQNLNTSFYKDYEAAKKEYQEEEEVEMVTLASNKKSIFNLFKKNTKINELPVEDISDNSNFFSDMEDVSAAQPVELESAAQPVELESAAQPVELESAAQPVELESAAQLVELESAAQPVELESADQYIIESDVPPVQQSSKHSKMIEFPLRNEYANVEEVKKALEDFRKNKLNVDYFLSKLLLSSPKKRSEELENEFVRKRVKASELAELNEFFQQQVESLERDLKMKLLSVYDEIVLDDYENKALTAIEKDIYALSEEKYQIANQEISNLENELQVKVNQFRTDLEIELERIKMEQKLKYDSFVEQQKAKNEKNIQLIKNHTEQKISEEVQSLTEQTQINLQKEAVVNMNTFKNELILNAVEDAEILMDKLAANLERNVANVKVELEKNQEIFERQINKEDAQQERLREEERAIKALQLKEEELNIMKSKQMEQSEEIALERQSGNSVNQVVELMQQLNAMQQLQKNAQSVASPVNAEVNDKKASLKMGVLGLLVGAVLIGSGALIGHNTSSGEESNTVNEAKAQTVESTGSNELKEILSLLSADQDVSLTQLLAEENYSLAAEKYNSKEDLVLIEKAIFNSDDVTALKIFNKSYSTPFSKLDLAILKNDEKAVVVTFNKLSSDEKEELNENQIARIKMILNNGEKNGESISVLEELNN